MSIYFANKSYRINSLFDGLSQDITYRSVIHFNVNTGYGLKNLPDIQQFLFQFLHDSWHYNVKEDKDVFLDNEIELKNIFNSIEGLTFIGNQEYIRNEFLSLKNYWINQKKYEIKQRMRQGANIKPIIPILKQCYDVDSKKYQFPVFKEIIHNSVDIVVWDWAYYDLHFHIFSESINASINKIIECAKFYKIDIITITDVNEIPNW